MVEARLAGAKRLERSCGTRLRERIVAAPRYPGIERIHAHFFGDAFAAHRHDTYALGVTLSGVQTFHYRGEKRFSLPGQVIILYPDELHDGGAGTEDGLHYRMLYLDPQLLRDALGSAPLPFVKGGVVTDPALRAVLWRALAMIGEQLDGLAVDMLVADLTLALSRHADTRISAARPVPLNAVHRARALLEAACDRVVRSSELEEATGLTRFELARSFRRAFGTSPYRFAVMRRLERARGLIENGETLSDVALATGFADQSHFSRHFKNAFGLSPGQWGRLTRQG